MFIRMQDIQLPSLLFYVSFRKPEKRMQSSEGKLKRVTRLSELCTERAMEKKLSTESLLSLPYEVFRALFGNSPGSRSSIIVINDSPLQVGENVINGVICGFHALSRKFIFGEYERGSQWG